MYIPFAARGWDHFPGVKHTSLENFTLFLLPLAERGDGIRVEFTDECDGNWTKFTFESIGKIKHDKTGKCLAHRDEGSEVRTTILELINDCNSSSHASWQIQGYPPDKGRLISFIDLSPSPT